MINGITCFALHKNYYKIINFVSIISKNIQILDKSIQILKEPHKNYGYTVHLYQPNKPTIMLSHY